ncbi:unnamed protein product, partial [Symbiodinium pilosum]
MDATSAWHCSAKKEALSMMARVAVALAFCLATCTRGAESWQELSSAFFADDDCEHGSEEACALNALQVGRCAIDFHTEVRVPMMDMVKQLKSITNDLVVKINDAIGSSEQDDLSKLATSTQAANKLLTSVGPGFLILLNKTNAIARDPGIAEHGQHAIMQEDSMLEMLKFTIVHAGIVMKEVIYSTGHPMDGNVSFATHINSDAQAARLWLKTSLMTAWEGAKDQLPRIKNLVNGSYGSPTVMAKQAACASNTATQISKLTTLYADIVSAGSDCNVSDTSLFSEEDCQSSALNVQSGIDAVIETGATMMWNCYKSSWVCAKGIAKTSNHLIKSFMSTIVMRDACKSSDSISLAVCKSESFQLLASLSSAAENMF